MKAARLVVVVIALAAGGLAALLAGRSGHEAAPPEATKPSAQIDTVEVLVAKNDINLGQSVGQQDMQWQIWPVSGGDTALPQTEEERNAGRKVGINTVRSGISTVTTPN
jgi:pilus assembly protein CpaB